MGFFLYNRDMFSFPARRIIQRSQSLLTFPHEPGAHNPTWKRFLGAGEQKLYYLGNSCKTCSFCFRRFGELKEPLVPAPVSQALDEGLDELHPALPELIEGLFPSGEYAIAAFEVAFERTQDDAPNDPFRSLAFAQNCSGTGTAYYASPARPLAEGVRLFEFFLPLEGQEACSEERVEKYMKGLQAGRVPALLALTQAQGRICMQQECATPEMDICLLHFILEGQAKAEAASRMGRSLPMLSFLNLGECIGGEDWALKARYGLESPVEL